MTSRNGKSYCDICNKALHTQKERIDVYKKRLGTPKIVAHYCIKCYDNKIQPLHNIKLKQDYNLLCKGLKEGKDIIVGGNSMSVFDAVMLKNQMENIYGFKEK